MKNKQEIIKKILKEAAIDLNSFGIIRFFDLGIKEKIKCIIVKLISYIHGDEELFAITWRTGLLAKAVFQKSEQLNDTLYIGSIEFYFKRFVNNNGRIFRLDHVYNGEVLIDFANKYTDSIYKDIIQQCRDFVINYRKDSEGSVAFFEKGCDVLVDGLMCCPFIFKYNRLYKRDEELYQIGINQILNFCRHGIDDITMLPFHGYNLKDNTQLGIAAWGRGVGWFLTSVILSLEYIDSTSSQYVAIREAFCKVAKLSQKYIHSNGLFNWALTCQKGPIDTSATSMILYSYAKAVNIGVLDKDIMQIVSVGYNSLLEYEINGHIYQSMGDCQGFAKYPQDLYDTYPWSNGFFILLDVELNKYYK